MLSRYGLSRPGEVLVIPLWVRRGSAPSPMEALGTHGHQLNVRVADTQSVSHVINVWDTKFYVILSSRARKSPSPRIRLLSDYTCYNGIYMGQRLDVFDMRNRPGYKMVPTVQVLGPCPTLHIYLNRLAHPLF